MLNNSIRKKLSTMHSVLKQHFAKGSGYIAGQKAPKLDDSSVNINIEKPDGTMIRIKALVGGSLWHELIANNVPIGGHCGGGYYDTLRDKRIEKGTLGPWCGGCYCNIDEPWFSRLGEIHWTEFEKNALLGVKLPPNIRYACSLNVEKWMDEMTIRIYIEKDKDLWEEDLPQESIY